MNVVLAIDSFKGCLSSAEAEAAAARAVRECFSDCNVVSLPVSDGGEGMMQALSSSLAGRFVNVAAHDPLMRPLDARYFLTDENMAVIEMAEASGLTLLKPEERNPLKTTSYGTGELIADALNRGCRRFIVGIGGSATNDAGLGMMQALGAKLLERVCKGENLCDIQGIDLSDLHPALNGAEFVVACDVNNPFCGEKGAAYVFAPQKGASPEQVEFLDSGMRHVASVIRATTGVDVTNIPGAGAAGGVGGAFIAFLNAKLRSGIDLILDAVNLETYLRSADLVITGEGKADRQTLMGKVPFGVLSRAKKYGVPTVLVAGRVEDYGLLRSACFAEILEVTPVSQPLHEAMRPETAKLNIMGALNKYFEDKLA